MQKGINQYGEVENTSEGAATVADSVLNNGSAFFRLCLGNGTAFQIVIVKAHKLGSVYGGVNYSIGIEGKGCYSFSLDGEIHPSYLVEKLNIMIADAEALAKFYENLSKSINV